MNEGTVKKGLRSEIRYTDSDTDTDTDTEIRTRRRSRREDADRDADLVPGVFFFGETVKGMVEKGRFILRRESDGVAEYFLPARGSSFCERCDVHSVIDGLDWSINYRSVRAHREDRKTLSTDLR